jgi:predicted metallopeptidase
MRIVVPGPFPRPLRQTAARRITRRGHQLLYDWSGEEGDRPLPLRVIRPLRPIPPPVRAPRTIWSLTPEPFHFSRHMRLLCQDIIARTHDLQHIDMSRVLVGVTRARSRRPHGLQARLTPLRFHQGQTTQRRRGWLYQVQRYHVAGIEILYLLTFCLPRFLDLAFSEKMITIFHELFHFSPDFDGDLRRHLGRYYQHSHSKKEYDELMRRYVADYFSTSPDLSLSGFLHHSFEELHERHGAIVGIILPTPKLVPMIHHSR